MAIDEMYAVCDALRSATDKAASLLEELGLQNATMRASSTGVLPDGTPVAGMLAELKETKAELAAACKLLRDVKYAANCRASERALALTHIRKLLVDY